VQGGESAAMRRRQTAMVSQVNTSHRSKEQLFFEALKNLFIGVPIEGESGYINLMRIKARYFERVLKPCLQKEIADALQPFPDFREELFDKLYTFFSRYFTEESGSIGFFFTPYHQSIYEQVYTNEQDVVLFWKTARLYYVKTDRLFQSMTVEVDGFRFDFDVSQLEHKRANEKRELVYEFKERQPDGKIIFTVQYSERGRQTRFDDIRRAIKDALGLSHYTDAVPSEETLREAFRIFERQSEVDYFICKDARRFLREQFDLWMWQYLLGKPGDESQTEWTETRLKQLQALKRIAYRVIDFIAAFEDELVKIWNKPKFVLNSHYVITLDRIAKQPGGMAVLERLLAHPNREAQIQEWRELGMVDENFRLEDVWDGGNLNPSYQYLPIDTKYFPDMEIQIIALFDNLDEALDGWLIKSENYQALRTILPKFQERVQTIYIDPPFNKKQDADYFYSVKYKDSTWITLLENRLQLAREILKDTGSIFVRCDYNGNMYVRLLMNEIFGEENFRNEIVLRKVNYQGTNVQGRFNPAHDLLYFYNKQQNNPQFKIIYKERDREPNWINAVSPKENKKQNTIYIAGRKFIAPKNHHWRFSQAKFNKLYAEGRIRIKEDYEYIDVFGNKQIGIPQYLESELTPVDSNWTDISGYSFGWKFPTENSEILLKRVIESTSNEGDIVMDFFLGIGTTTAVAHKLGRRWIGIEMGEHFYSFQPEEGGLSGVLVRMKEILAGKGNHEPCGISKDIKWQGGGFFKYYELEQYEDTLRRTRYLDDDLFTPPEWEDPCQYLFMRDPKMSEALEVDLEQGKVKVDLGKLYKNIDLPETLSNLTGKLIKRIYPDPDDPSKPAYVEFTDGEKIDLKNLDWRLIKPLIWW
jgi:adenine-specific DNA-methyltransferase